MTYSTEIPVFLIYITDTGIFIETLNMYEHHMP